VTLQVYIDGDACPVKDEVYRVAKRYQLAVTLVANSWMRTPDKPSVALVVVEDDFDAADDWIVDQAAPGDIVVTADILLAKRCLSEGARVLGPSGKPFTEENIGGAVATRELMAELRMSGEITGGPPPMQKRDRSQFLQKLDEMVQRSLREVTRE